MPVKVKIKKLHEDAVLPQQMTEGAAAFDLTAIEDIFVPNVRAYDKAMVIPLGFAMEIPKGYHAKIVLRSSIGMNTKLRLSNQVGIIDSDYRGEVKLLIENLGAERARIAKGTRIAQMIIEKTLDVVFEATEKLSDTKRGEGGFGSTNKPKP